MTLYTAIYGRLKAEIEAGRWKKAFPSEAQLVQRFGVSRQTVIRAMSELVKTGLIERRRGSGTVVSRRVRHMVGRIGLVLPLLKSSPFTNALAEVCDEEGYSLCFKDVSTGDRIVPESSLQPTEFFRERAAEASAVAKEIAAAKVSGVLVQPVQGFPGAKEINRGILREFAWLGIPVVLIDHDICFPPDRSRCDVVSLDNFGAGYAVARHLLERGAKRMLFLARRDWAPSIEARLHGVCAANIDVGLPWTAEGSVAPVRADDTAAVSRILRKAHPDAIVCGNDIAAARLLSTLASLGVEVPGRVRVAGFDDAPYAATVKPPLTTVRQDFVQIARAATHRLAWRMHHPDAPPSAVLLPGELVVREST